MGKAQLIVALDVDTMAEAERLVVSLRDQVPVFKVGLQLFLNVGPDIFALMRRWGAQMFLDLKFHDIPNTVAQAARLMTEAEVLMFNVHISGGREMIAQAAMMVREEAGVLGVKPPLLLGVTVLTSLQQQALQELGLDMPVQDLVLRWARLAQEAGLDGVVASPREVAALRQACGPDFVIVTPGIRPAGEVQHDQQRVATPAQAVRAGSDYLVVGRPVTGVPDPRKAVRSILREMEEAQS